MAKDKKDQKFVYDAFDLIKYAWDKKMILIGVSVITFIAASVISLFLNDRFKSTVVLFPAASVSVSKNLVETAITTSDTKDILSFGEDEEAERLLQVLNSDKIRTHITKKFNLMEHYEIDTAAKKFPHTQLIKKFRGNVKYRRTEFLSIEIEVLDQDAQMAADMANEIAAYIDKVFTDIKRDRAVEAFAIVDREYQSSREIIEAITDSLNKIRALGVQDYASQSDALNTGLSEALLENNTRAIKAFEEKLEIMNKYGGPYIEYSEKLVWEIQRFSKLRSKYAAAKVNLGSTMTNVFVVDKATKSERKAVPKRSIIVIISTLSAFALSLLILLIIDIIKARS